MKVQLNMQIKALTCFSPNNGAEIHYFLYPVHVIFDAPFELSHTIMHTEFFLNHSRLITMNLFWCFMKTIFTIIFNNKAVKYNIKHFVMNFFKRYAHKNPAYVAIDFNGGKTK